MMMIKMLDVCFLLGKLSVSGLRLFQADSSFLLFYKDKYEQWRKVGDVPWK